jgi:serine/threonine protein kinase
MTNMKTSIASNVMLENPALENTPRQRPTGVLAATRNPMVEAQATGTTPDDMDDDAGLIPFIRGYHGVSRARKLDNDESAAGDPAVTAAVAAAPAATVIPLDRSKWNAPQLQTRPSGLAPALAARPDAVRVPAESLSSFDSSRPGSPVSSPRQPSNTPALGLPPTQAHPLLSPASATFPTSPRSAIAAKSVSFAHDTVESPMTASGSDDPNVSASTSKSVGSMTFTCTSSPSRRASLRSRVARAGSGRRHSHAACDMTSVVPCPATSANPFLTRDPPIPQREPPLSLRARQFRGTRIRRDMPSHPGHNRTYSAESWSRQTSGPSNSSNLSLLSSDLPAVVTRSGRLHSTSAPTTPQWMRFGNAVGPSGPIGQGIVAVPPAAETEASAGPSLSAVYPHLPHVAAINVPAQVEPVYSTPASASTSAPGGAAKSTANVMLPAGSSPGVLSPSPASNDMTFLECVVDLLRGCSCLKRKNIVWALDSQIWLTPDMSTVKYRTLTKKGTVTDEFLVSKVRKVRATEREITITADDKNKAVEFIFPSREKTNIWLSGLCCLVPSRAAVKSRYKLLEQRQNYDPLQDSWEGKPLSSRKRFNEYILLGTIGRGAFGKVKLALSSENRQFYAVKVLCKFMMRKQNRASVFDRTSQEIRKSSGVGTSEQEQFPFADVNEISIMKILDHPNVVKMRSIFDDVENDRLYIVVEFVACGPVMSSSRLTGAQPLREDRVREIFLDVFAGLQYLHYNGIVHRDLKPDNLLKAGDQTVKISDFGAAKLYEDVPDKSNDEDTGLPNYRTTVGTPAFTAPELCLSEKSPPAPVQSFAADIWSLGATLYYMLYGRAPYFAKSVFEMYDAICTQPLEFPELPKTSRHVRDLMRDMMERLPEKRATFERILCSPWLREDAELRERVAELIQIAKQHERQSHGSREDVSFKVRANEL